MTQPDQFDLEAAFATARAAPPRMSDDLAARIVVDAVAHVPLPPLWRRVLASIGGPAGFGGLVTATVAGFWLGVAPPVDGVDPLVMFGTVLEDSVTDITGLDWTEFDFESEEG